MCDVLGSDLVSTFCAEINITIINKTKLVYNKKFK